LRDGGAGEAGILIAWGAYFDGGGPQTLNRRNHDKVHSQNKFENKKMNAGYQFFGLKLTPVMGYEFILSYASRKLI